MMESRRRNNKKKDFRNIIIICVEVALAVVIVFCCVKIIIWFIGSKKDSKKHEELIQQVVKIYNEDSSIYNDTILKPEEKTEFVIDFEKLKEINSDIVGWIQIDNTNINYPVLRADDNDYYLHRNYEREYSQSGSIFLDYENHNLLENNILIYGHNMSDGLMFHQLSRIYDGELGNEIYVKLYTKDQDIVFKVFSVYMIDPDEFNCNISFTEARDKSIRTFNYENVNSNRLMTLYTCNLVGDKRIIVHCAFCNN